MSLRAPGVFSTRAREPNLETLFVSIDAKQWSAKQWRRFTAPVQRFDCTLSTPTSLHAAMAVSFNDASAAEVSSMSSRCKDLRR